MVLLLSFSVSCSISCFFPVCVLYHCFLSLRLSINCSKELSIICYKSYIILSQALSSDSSRFVRTALSLDIVGLAPILEKVQTFDIVKSD